MSAARRTLGRVAAQLVLACGLVAAAVAQPGLASDEVRPWSSLDPAQRRALAPLQGEWAAIDGPRQQKWLELADRFDRMSPAERSRVQQRMDDWVRLSPRERSEARRNYQGARELSPQERKARWEDYQALPEDQRRKLRRRGDAPAEASTPAADAGKANTVPNPLHEGRKPRPVAPATVQARPGVTTNSLAPAPAGPPLQTGLPKVAATPEFVDPNTLLPQRGPQGAGAEPRRRADGRDKPARER